MAHGDVDLNGAPNAATSPLSPALAFVASLRFAFYFNPSGAKSTIVARGAATWLHWLCAQYAAIVALREGQGAVAGGGQRL